VPATHEYDVFLSYNHGDDEAFGLERRRWVSSFCEDFSIRLRQVLGRKAAVFMDPRQPGEIDFEKDIVEALNSSALFLAVLSPSYVQSDWCARELTQFAAVADANGGLFVSNACRVLKVFKTPVEREKVSELNSQLDAPLGFEFFALETLKDRIRELSIHENAEVRKLYDARVDDVAQAAKRVLSYMGLAERRRVAAAGTVYLAETTSDLSEQSLNLRRELEARGFEILPHYQLPRDGREAQSTIRQSLKRSRCSIHLFGKRIGWIPEGESRSVVVLQHELAAEREGDDFTRFLWIPPGLDADPAQDAFLQQLRQMPGSRANFELAEVPFEELKAMIREKLATDADASRRRSRHRRLYVLFDAVDDVAGEAIAERLSAAGVDVQTPLHTGDTAADAKDHQETLKRADVVAVYWAESSAAWVRERLRELQDFREAAPPGPETCVVLCGPDSPHKQRLRPQGVTVIRIGDSNDVQSLVPVVEAAPLRRGTTP
jgi:hypothetical protein